MREVVLVNRDQRGDELLTVTNHHALADQSMGTQSIFQNGRSDILAGGRNNDFLLTSGDAEEAIVVEFADVAGVEEAVCPDRLARWRPRWRSSRA